MKPIKSYICGCTYNVEPYLEKVLKNIQHLSEIFDDYYIIFSHDDSEDNTLTLLENFMMKHPGKMKIVQGNKQLGDIRTQNIANARNKILYTIKVVNPNNTPPHKLSITANFQSHFLKSA
jgi:glycosyltransferase involved in cell wall biosynthesis